jgi:hypothetical protein
MRSDGSAATKKRRGIAFVGRPSTSHFLACIWLSRASYRRVLAVSRNRGDAATFAHSKRAAGPVVTFVAMLAAATWSANHAVLECVWIFHIIRGDRLSASCNDNASADSIESLLYVAQPELVRESIRFFCAFSRDLTIYSKVGID